MLTTIEKVLLLQDFDLFRWATTEHLAQIASLCREREEGAEQTLFQRGDSSRILHLLVDGRVRLGEPEQVVQKGALDLLSFLAQQPHSVSAFTLEPCSLLTLEFEPFEDLLSSEGELAWALLRFLAERALAEPTSIPPGGEGGSSP